MRLPKTKTTKPAALRQRPEGTRPPLCTTDRLVPRSEGG
jgi:hypothetical protein